jgi:RNA polymerase sigma factor for flagellar operon FliA
MTVEKVPGAASGEALLLSQLPLIERVIAATCARYRLSAADADDFSSHVKLRLVEDDYSILRRFEGRSSLGTYLTIVIQRLVLDHRNKAWGKWRPSAEARRGGHVAVLLERLTVRDGHTFEEACEMLTSNHGVTAERAELERLAARFPVRVRRRFQSDDALAETPGADGAPDETLARRDAQRTAAQVSELLRRLTANLEPQDRLILKMRFEDGRTVADIAATLRLEQKGLYRRLARLLAGLREGFERQGVDTSTIQDLLAAPADIEWSGPEKTDPRPSMVGGGPQWR